MAHFGCGIAMYHPVSALDMQPPCVGYLDTHRRWNHLTNIEWAGDGMVDSRVYEPLEKIPQKMAQVNMEWRPRTSLGVRQYIISAQGETPDIGLPVGADASVRYASKTRFGAVLISQKPVILTSYNDETLFRRWLASNRARLAELHGVELARYGLWIVTRTYTTPRASINGWLSKDKEASMSLKAKASMIGDIGGSLDWNEKGMDKDWAHYSGDEGVVTFFDGFHIPAWKWCYHIVKARLAAIGGEVSRKEKIMLHHEGLLPRRTWSSLKNVHVRGRSAPGADDACAVCIHRNFAREEKMPKHDDNALRMDTRRRPSARGADDTQEEPPAKGDLDSPISLRRGKTATRSLSGKELNLSMQETIPPYLNADEAYDVYDLKPYPKKDTTEAVMRLETTVPDAKG
ncbi:MAG: hypothetical protein Q9163_002601 [Psora crenata]